jgi:glucose/arabinose dehydrogenase
MHQTSSAALVFQPDRSMEMRRPLIRLLFILVCGVALGPASAPTLQAQSRQFSLPPGFVQELVADTLGPATAFALAPDGRILIARKGGAVKLYRDGELRQGLFIDLSSQINRYADRGLMGIAIHPNFPNPAYVYLAYTYEPPETAGHAVEGARVGRVLRVEADPNNLDAYRPGSEVVLLGAGGTFATMGNPDRGDRPPYSCMGQDGVPVQDCLPVDGPSHTVDWLAFGPDGALYVSVGDATLQPELNIRAQDVDSLAGKMLRIDPLTGQGYRDNPFFDGNPTSNRSKVYALGLRNPFRFTFEPETGQVVVGDVGGERWEEINIGGPGSNFGWPCLEGPARLSNQPVCAELFSGRQPTISAWHSYSHQGVSGAAIGGVFYTGDRFPAAYRNAYFFADHNQAALLYLTPNSDGSLDRHEFANNAVALVQMAVGPEGDLYVLSFTDGALSRIRYVGGQNRPPQANLVAEPTSGMPPLQVTFSSQGSADPDQSSLTYHWQFGDGAESNEANTVHVYQTAGPHEVQLTVTDADGASATTSLTIQVGANAPVAQILAPTAESQWRVGEMIAVQGQAFDVEDGPLDGDQLVWDATLHHNEHVHPDYFHAQGTTARLAFEPHGDNIYLELCLTATDQDGLQGRTCVNLQQAQGDAPTAESAEITPTSLAGPGSGHILREQWLGIGGNTVADLLGSPRYPDDPDVVDTLTRLESTALGKDYGVRLRGYLHPPVDGDYHFWIASDDSSELWLSTDANPANTRLIASIATWAGYQQWGKEGNQASPAIGLQAGQRYYLEIRHKQADQKDNLSVAWQIPGQGRAVVEGEYLSPVTP